MLFCLKVGHVECLKMLFYLKFGHVELSEMLFCFKFGWVKMPFWCQKHRTTSYYLFLFYFFDLFSLNSRDCCFNAFRGLVLVKTISWTLNWMSEWERKMIWAILSVTWLLVPDGPVWVFHNLLRYWDFHT